MSKIIYYYWEEGPPEWENNISRFSAALQAMSVRNSNRIPNREMFFCQETESEEDDDDENNDVRDDDDETEAVDRHGSQEDESGVLWGDREGSSVEKMNHYFHPHPLYKFKLEPDDNTKCNICGRVIHGFAHGCEPCDFFIHDDNTCLNLNGSGVQKMNHFSHPHPLYQFKLEKNDNAKCNICDRLIFGLVHGCKPCKFFVHDHNNCLNLPRQIQHKSHPHPLHLLPQPHHNTCDACLSNKAHSPFYRCNICDYDLHKKCADLPDWCPYGQLYYSFPPGASDRCSECNRGISKRGWVWYERNSGPTTHLKCLSEDQMVGQTPSIFRHLIKYLIRRKSNRATSRRRG